MRKALISLVLLAIFLLGCSKNNEVTGNAVAVDKASGNTVQVDKATEPTANKATGICKDSDGGVNTGIKGIVDIGDKRYYDTCLGGLLVEYYCDGDKVTNQNIRCPKECKGGKCV